MAIFNSYVSLPEGMFANQNSIINIYIYTHTLFIWIHMFHALKKQRKTKRERERDVEEDMTERKNI